MEWISVKDKLPDECEELLMTYNDLVSEGKFVNGKFYYPSLCSHTVEGYCRCEEQEGITHWMPLPEPPSNNECINHMWTWMPNDQSICMSCGVLKNIGE